MYLLLDRWIVNQVGPTLLSVGSITLLLRVWGFGPGWMIRTFMDYIYGPTAAPLLSHNPQTELSLPDPQASWHVCLVAVF